MKIQEGVILIVDDDKVDQVILREAFNSLKVTNELIFLSSVPETLDYLKINAENVFLIISDMHLHLENGLNLKLEMDKVPEIKKLWIPFIFMSNTATREEVQNAYDSGVQGYFFKGYSLEQTLKNMEVILNYWDNCRNPRNPDLI